MRTKCGYMLQIFEKINYVLLFITMHFTIYFYNNLFIIIKTVLNRQMSLFNCIKDINEA